MTEARQVCILLAEDDEDDVLLLRRALRDAEVALDLHVVPDGEACLAFLRGEPPYEEEEDQPDLLLLDINMPRKGGFEVLDEMKADPQLRRTPVIMLTTSRQDSDVLKAYDKQCASYVVKPARFEEFKQVVQRFEAFWLATAMLPPRSRLGPASTA